MPRETTRRKLDDLVKKNLITINAGAISILPACFNIENLDNILKNFTSCLNLTISNTVNKDQNIREEVSTTYLLNNF